MTHKKPPKSDTPAAADTSAVSDTPAVVDTPTAPAAPIPQSERFLRFSATYSFALDPFQVQACAHIDAGKGVLVAAPTGSGKTVVGEYAIWLALESGLRCCYTTPIKALSNQKYHDLVARHGEAQVGLLTGDQVINGDAPVLVMTTEVLRNMIYTGSSTLQGLGYVVMDEVHYLADRFRGAVWEEVILGLADSVQLVALSATVSNAEEFGAWLHQTRASGVEVVISETRPVPLYQHMMVGHELHPLLAKNGNAINPKLMGIAVEQSGRQRSHGPRRPHGSARRDLVPRRSAVVIKLQQQRLLPAIFFIFSRAGCDGAVRHLLGDDVRLTTAAERDELLRIAQRHGASLSYADRQAIGWETFTQAFARGISAHHAGLLPLVKNCVEEGFVRGLLKVVFATETLALGINMPAKSVVLEKLIKFNGEVTAEITPAEYTQLTGRAGRRGIDVEGHAVVLWSTTLNPKMVAGLAGKRTYPLLSSFAPTYNMAVNLVGSIGRERAAALLARSFAQFQSDRHTLGRRRAIADEFQRVCQLLDHYGYLDGDQVSAPGKMLARIYSELDLVVAEAVRTSVFESLDVPQLAAVLSTLVYEGRMELRDPAPMPDTATRSATRALNVIRREIVDNGKRFGIDAPRTLDTGFAFAARDWAAGESLAVVLDNTRLAAGDFVRWIRQIIDLASQIAQAPGVGALRDQARAVITALRRDIIVMEDGLD
ncbi:MAG: DEAD/DEAH box helicase [Propionibacteriaceae bacterium]|jgi:ATP-dependent RNA helicase HelY|nr:DEAD/DEAH box helicase [Propionibacteriaceae bacterium]